jgi:hypothetical protein
VEAVAETYRYELPQLGNDLSAQLQQGILTSLGMGHLLSVRPVEGR